MSYTNSTGQPQGFPQTIASKIREALISKLVATNGYSNHIANSNMPDVNKLLKEIINDDEKHYKMFLKLIHDMI